MSKTMTGEEVYRSLLLQKKELVFKLLRLANDTPLTDPSPEKNVENYVGLVDAREEIIDELKGLDGKLSQLAVPPGMADESALLGREIKEMADQIARLEPDIQKKASDIMAQLQREMKSINNSKKVSGEYTPGMLYERKA